MLQRIDIDKKGVTELGKRAQELYFDVNPDLELIYCDSFGRFSENFAALKEPIKHIPDAKIYTFKRSNTSKKTK